MVLTLTDPIKALVTQLATATDVVALTNSRIAAEVNPLWTMPKSAVVLTPSGGTIDPSPPLGTARVTLRCFAPKYAHDALNLRNRVIAFLIPQVPGQAGGFTAAGCVVHGIDHEGGPFRPGDFEGKPWPVLQDFLLVRYSLVGGS